MLLAFKPQCASPLPIWRTFVSELKVGGLNPYIASIEPFSALATKKAGGLDRPSADVKLGAKAIPQGPWMAGLVMRPTVPKLAPVGFVTCTSPSVPH